MNIKKILSSQIFKLKKHGLEPISNKNKLPYWIAKYTPVNIVIPRALCFYHRVSCAGIPFLKLRAFAKIQANIKSPFSEFGLFSLKQDDYIHLWIWSKEIEKEIEKEISYKLGGNQRFRIYPSSLAAKKKSSGVLFLYDDEGQGVESQLWVNHKLCDSLFFSEVPTPLSWSRFLSENPTLSEIGWPSEIDEELEISDKQDLWGLNLTPSANSYIAINFALLFELILVLSTFFIIVWGANSLARINATQKFINSELDLRASTSAELEPIIEAKNRVKTKQDWIEGVNSLVPSPSITSILQDFSKTWPAKELLIRELDISPPTIQVTFVSRKGTAQLTQILETVESNNFYYDAKFLDVVGGDGLKLSWRIKSSRIGKDDK